LPPVAARAGEVSANTTVINVTLPLAQALKKMLPSVFLLHAALRVVAYGLYSPRCRDYLKGLDHSSKVPRPRHQKADEHEQEAFKKGSR
jgi:hypothetical protein